MGNSPTEILEQTRPHHQYHVRDILLSRDVSTRASFTTAVAAAGADDVGAGASVAALVPAAGGGGGGSGGAGAGADASFAGGPSARLLLLMLLPLLLPPSSSPPPPPPPPLVLDGNADGSAVSDVTAEPAASGPLRGAVSPSPSRGVLAASATSSTARGTTA